MSKTVKIPSYQNPCEIIINGVKYQYPAGEICLVPDDVAMVIENVENNAPKYAKENVRRPDIVEAVSGEVITASYSAEAPLHGLKVFGKTIQNGTPAPDAPVALESVGAKGKVTVKVVGKNLVNTSSLPLFAGLPKQSLAVDLPINIPAGHFVIHTATTSGITRNNVFSVALYGREMDEIKQISRESSHSLNSACEFTLSREEALRAETIRIYYNYANDISRIDGEKLTVFQIEAGSIATEYELYKEPQIITIFTPSGLSGIPVSSGGNYTDANGQQWICDEIDFEKGVYIQRVGKIDSYNGQALSGAYISSTGALSTGAIVLYQLASAKKTDINKEKLEAYAAMHTNCPSTTVYNDSDAGMEVKYVADTKLYVDKKFNVLAAMVNNA